LADRPFVVVAQIVRSQTAEPSRYGVSLPVSCWRPGSARGSAFLARGIEGLAVEPSTGVRDGLDVAGRDGVDGVVDVDVDINTGATRRSSDGAAAATEPMRFELSTKPRRILPQPPSGSNRRLWDRVIALILSSDANTARLVIHRDAIA